MKILQDFEYCQDDWTTIYCGDCLEIMPLMKPESFGLIITDPPYGINHPTDYYSRRRGVRAECKDYPKVYGDDKSFDPKPFLIYPAVLWGANHYASRLPDASGWLVWDKERPGDLDQATCELAWTNFVKGVRIFHFLWHGMSRNKKKRHGEQHLCHPTQKPVELIKWILQLRWTPVGTVLDPFLGSGTTCVAAKEINRKSIGIEMSEEYCEIAKKRIEKTKARQGLRLLK